MANGLPYWQQPAQKRAAAARVEYEKLDTETSQAEGECARLEKEIRDLEQGAEQMEKVAEAARTAEVAAHEALRGLNWRFPATADNLQTAAQSATNESVEADNKARDKRSELERKRREAEDARKRHEALRQESDEAWGRYLLARRALVDHPTRFELYAPAAEEVVLMGSFNGWGGKGPTIMAKGAGDVWSAEVFLKPGRHEYKFRIDGCEVWVVDPNNPPPDGCENSVIEA